MRRDARRLLVLVPAVAAFALALVALLRRATATPATVRSGGQVH